MAGQFRFLPRLGAFMGLSAAAGLAQAHTGLGAHDLAQGLSHPLLGLDHLLAMVAVGLWSAAVLPARCQVAGPLVFMTLLLLGAVAGAAGLVLAAAEAAIALSVVALAGLLLLRRRVPAAAGLTLIGLSALLHGYAHGTELAVGASFAAYAAGFLLSTAALHASGWAGGRWLARARTWVWHTVAALMGGAGLAMWAARL